MPVVDGKHYPYTKKGKAAANKARQGKSLGGRMDFGIGIQTTDDFQVPNFTTGRFMGMAPKKSSKPKGISGAQKYSAPPTPLPKKLGMRDRFTTGGGVAKPN